MPPSPVFSPTCSASSSTDLTSDVSIISNRTETPDAEIPVDIVSEEEMALIEAALSAATAAASSRVPSRSWAALSHCRRHTTSPRSMPSLLSQSQPPDIEDSAKPLPRRSLFREFRARRGLTVTDITATEWCEKQMEFALMRGKPKRTEAMIAGSNRHVQLEDEIMNLDLDDLFIEVVERIEIQTKSIEDLWAVKLLNFIVGVNQLLFEGVTRELPVIGLVEGVWLKGVIDEVRMPVKEALNPVLLDTKTRQKVTLPSEAQKRNARLQLMCYKYLWDNLTLDSIPKDRLFSYFRLNPYLILSKDVNNYIASLGFRAKTLEDVLTYFGSTCSSLPQSQEQLILRYELQSDHSLLEEYKFDYDDDWFRTQIKDCFKFWLGEREANYVSEAERWKCRFCSFNETCPMSLSREAM